MNGLLVDRKVLRTSTALSKKEIKVVVSENVFDLYLIQISNIIKFGLKFKNQI